MYKEAKNIYNETLPLYFGRSLEVLFINEFYLELSSIDSLGVSSERIADSSLLVSLIVGPYFKSALYSYFYLNFMNLKENPINLLILLQAIIQHLICVFMIVNYVEGLNFNITFVEHFGEFWCIVFWNFQIYGVAYRNIGSLGLAIARLLYIKCSN